MIWLSSTLLLAVGLTSVGPSCAEVIAPVIEAIRSTPAVRVESELTIEVRAGDVIESISPTPSVYVVDGSRRCLLRSDGWSWWVLEDELLMVHQHDSAAYVRMDRGASPLGTLRSHFRLVPDPLLTVLLGGSDPDAVLGALHDGSLELRAAEEIEAGRLFRLSGADSSVEFQLDSDGRLAAATVDLRSGSDDASHVRQRWNWTWTYDALELDEVDAALDFDRGDRYRVDDVRVLRRTPPVSPRATERSVGPAAPPLTLPDDEGSTIQLGQFRGQVVVVDFWSSTCTSCVNGLTALQRRAHQWAEEGLPVQVLSVNTMEQNAEGALSFKEHERLIDRFRSVYGLDCTMLIDVGGKAAGAWGVEELPATFIVDPDGRLAGAIDGRGPVTAAMLDAAVRRVLEGSPSGKGRE